MKPFEIPKPSDIKENDRTEFDFLWDEITLNHKELIRKLLWLSIMDQLVEGHATLTVNYDLDEVKYNVALELMESFKSNGFVTDSYVDSYNGNDIISIIMPNHSK